MANTVNITTVNDGPRNICIHVYIASDGASGDITDQVLIDPADYGLPSTTRFGVQGIEYNFSGMSARIEFDSGLVDDNLIWVLGENNSSADLDRVGGLVDRSGLDGTGKIQITTTGLSSLGDEGSLLLCVRK